MHRLLAGLGLALLAACTGETEVGGGSRPELVAVPEAPGPRYDAFERAVLREALEQGRQRLETTSGEASTVPDAVRPPARATPALGPAEAGIEDNLATADDLVDLAEAVLRDRSTLARRAEIRAAFAATPDPVERVTVVAFAPGQATLSALERQRLALAVSAVEAETEAGAAPIERWIVTAGGADGGARAAAVLETMTALGVAAPDIELVAGARDVDVAEIDVRR